MHGGVVRSNRKNDQKENKKKAGEKKEEKKEQVGERPANSYEQYGTSSNGRKKNKSDRGKGKNIELMRKHYGIIRRRQTKITDYLMLGDVRRLARRPNKSHSYCLNCITYKRTEV
ncbi:hypothetical protein PRIPAC_92936 [Pristionchus pacificus]|uniref:Uncharacterized protein n=1 Tax=Pristionchus pacificus TaxID=54126 RepID=A0A2A6BQ66_PRIPA|nr:hypothetical protein PRIPAC_92936 [Pristionchus pacificus]|eukprot:PDM68008.1 hypothetical protein PRIPAC_46052 [Pristionchus pacificus]